MGCTQSKIDTDEAVARCKERRQWMKAAVGSRNAFAAAHFAYAVALKETGGALYGFAQGEAQDLLRPPNYAATAAAAAVAAATASASAFPAAAAAIQPPVDSAFLPPPPLPLSDFQPLQRAASMPEIPLTKRKKAPPAADATIREEEEGEEEPAADDDDDGGGGDITSSSSSLAANARAKAKAKASASSPPPPPPPPPPPQQPPSPRPPPPMPESNWDTFFFGSAEEHMQGHTLGEPEEPPRAWPEPEPERRELEQHDKVKKMSAATAPPPVEEIRLQEPTAVIEEKVLAEPPPPKPAKKSRPGGGSVEPKRSRMVAAVPNIVIILEQIDEHFLKASESAHEVSKMLEATRMHYHSNFADSRGKPLSLSLSPRFLQYDLASSVVGSSVFRNSLAIISYAALHVKDQSY